MEICLSTAHEGIQGPLPLRAAILQLYLTAEEEDQIIQQFRGAWRRNSQVMWSGMRRERAQQWADERGIQTLATAMGPLMVLGHPSCLKGQKNSNGWSKYMKGASAVFAYHISMGEKVTVLTPPPPDKFNPTGMTNYQAIEEPILKELSGRKAPLRIEMVHPMIEGAEDFSYEVWPVDRTDTWVEKFGISPLREQCWRAAKKMSTILKTYIVYKGAVADQSPSHHASEPGLAQQSHIQEAGDVPNRMVNLKDIGVTSTAKEQKQKQNAVKSSKKQDSSQDTSNPGKASKSENISEAQEAPDTGKTQKKKKKKKKGKAKKATTQQSQTKATKAS